MVPVSKGIMTMTRINICKVLSPECNDDDDDDDDDEALCRF